ncbi:MAG: hypothetical protein JZU65_16215 [Chlorobium sp.]|nr:hypothetical protein [Chlorobium sp.]
MTQADAYRKAYKSNKMKSETIQNNAHTLMKNSEVAARVSGLKAEVAAKHLWTREDSVNALKGVVNSPDRAGDVTAAVKELNAMHGFNAPTKNEHSFAGPDGQPLSFKVVTEYVAPKNG